MIKDSHVGDMRRYSAISDLAPLGSVEKYSVNVIRCSKKVVGGARVHGLVLQSLA